MEDHQMNSQTYTLHKWRMVWVTKKDGLQNDVRNQERKGEEGHQRRINTGVLSEEPETSRMSQINIAFPSTVQTTLIWTALQRVSSLGRTCMPFCGQTWVARTQLCSNRSRWWGKMSIFCFSSTIQIRAIRREMNLSYVVFLPLQTDNGTFMVENWRVPD